MKHINTERLIFRRQFLVTPKLIDCPYQFIKQNITKNYFLYSHVDLLLTGKEKSEKSLILLGDLIDYREPGKTNSDILDDLIDCSLQDLLEQISHYAGRFVLIVADNNKLFFIHDALAARKVFYCNHNQEIWIGSQPHLLAKVLELKNTTNSSKIKFYKSDAFRSLHSANIGDTTCYDDIFQLIPNHYLATNPLKIVRYWPNKKIEKKPVKEVVKKCSQIISGIMEGISNRYDIMLPVTAGKDSRMLLAASKKIKNNIFFYLNKEPGVNLNQPDYVIPKKIFEKLKLVFHLLELGEHIDEDFKKVYFANNPYATDSYLPHIYNYFVNFQDKVNLPGNIATAGFEQWHYKKMRITANSLAHLSDVGEYQFAVSYYEKWLHASTEPCKSSNINLLHLFYWEERLGNWGTQVQLDKDIAQEDINPFNCRSLNELFLSVPDKYIERPFFRLQREIIKYLWPDLIEIPINPSKQGKFLILIKYLGLQNVFQKIVYELKLIKKKRAVSSEN